MNNTRHTHALAAAIVTTVFALLTATAAAPAAKAQKFEGLGLTPQMGWNSWNKFACDIDEELIKETADEMVSTGLRDAGYIYLNLDDCWHGQRDSNGFIQCDPERFPGGMKALCDYVHSKGLKIGIYSDAGTHTCAGRAGSLGHEYQDALQYARWGFDYLKYDWCYTTNVNPKGAYTLMRDALHATGRPIFFSMCEWGSNQPWAWAKDVGNSWRTTGDISANFESVLYILDRQDGLRDFAGPGHWNDPDMLEVGNGMTVGEDRAHFTMWCMLAAPLILGNDLTDMTEETRAIILNRKMIAVDQDSLGVQGLRIGKKDGIEYWLKPLEGGDWAFALLNRDTTETTVTVDWGKMEFDDPISGRATNFRQVIYDAENLWKTEATTSTADNFTVSVPGHDAAAYRLRPTAKGGLIFTVGPDNDSLYKAGEMAKITFSARNPAAKTLKESYIIEVFTDKGEPYKTFKGKVNVKPGANDEVSTSFDIEPGFYKVRVLKGTAKNNKLIRQFNVGCSPEEVTSAPDAKRDFDSFWAASIAELENTEPHYVIARDDCKSGEGRDLYQVRMTSFGGAEVGGWLAVPKEAKEGESPVRITFLGYDSDGWTPDTSYKTEWIDFVFSGRGQGIFKPGNTYGDWVVYGLDSKENYYYRGAYLDLIRAIDFVCTLPEADKNHIFAEGDSQGGAFTLIAASLDSRLRAVCPGVPFLSDFKDYFKVADWPAAPILKEQKRLGLSDEELYETLSYFDVKNFTSKIDCPVLMGFGLQDRVCPPRTNMAGFNNIGTSDKEYICFKHKGHDIWREQTWRERRDSFYESFLDR